MLSYSTNFELIDEKKPFKGKNSSYTSVDIQLIYKFPAQTDGKWPSQGRNCVFPRP
jgi:hypothetical protein